MSYCFAIKTIKHKISKVFRVTYVDVFIQFEQSSYTEGPEVGGGGRIPFPSAIL